MRWEVKKVKLQKVVFDMSRGTESERDFSAFYQERER
jgi:hypothetical protein